MRSDSLTYNPNPLPQDKISVFKAFVMAQDEVPGYFRIGEITGNSQDKLPDKILSQKKTDEQLLYHKSLFTSHTVNLLNTEPISIHRAYSDWPFFILAAALSLLIALRFIYFKRLNLLLRSFFSPRFTATLIREGGVKFEMLTLGLQLVFFIVTGLLINKATQIYFGTFMNINTFLVLMAYIISFFVVKFVLTSMISVVFKTKKESQLYIINNKMFHVVAGMVLLPLCFILYYANTPAINVIFYFSMVLLLLLFVFSLIRGVISGISVKKNNLYYLFLYFCTVEILPLIIIVKIVVNYYLTGTYRVF